MLTTEKATRAASAPATPDGGEPARILVVSLDNLGDLVFASALTPPIRERFPDASIGLWCKAYTAEIAPLVPHVDRIVAADPFWDRAPGRGKGPMRDFLRSVLAVRRDRYDVAVLAAAPWRTAAAVAATGIPVRIGLERRRNRRWLTRALPPEDKSKPVMHEIARLLEPLGIAPPPLRYRLDPAPLASRQARLRARLGPAPYAALHAFASKRNRCVDPREWIALAEMLEARGLGALWVGSPAELSELRALAGERAGWLYGDQLLGGSLAEAATALSMASLFVGHDSGPLHVANALGVPSVGIFAPGEPRRTFPQGVGPSRVLYRPSPEGITASEMLAEVDALPPAVRR